MQVHVLAKELGITSRQIQDLLDKPAPTSKMDEDEVQAVREQFPVSEQPAATAPAEAVQEEAAPTPAAPTKKQRASVVFWSENSKHAIPTEDGRGLIKFIDFRLEAYADGQAYAAIMKEKDSEIRIVVDKKFKTIHELKQFRGMRVERVKTGHNGEESLLRGLAFVRALFNPGTEMEEFASTMASDGADGVIELAVQTKSFKVL